MGPPLRREAGRERWLGKLRRRCGTAAAPIFLPLRPPVGPDGTAPKHSCFCAPEMFCPLQGVTPVTGVRGLTPLVKGRWPKARGDRDGRIWTRSVHPEPSPGDPQGELPRRGKRRWPGPLVSFPAMGKKLAARRRQNSPAYNKCSPKPAPSSGPFGATFPPGGRLRKGRRRNFSAPIQLPITHSNI